MVRRPRLDQAVDRRLAERRIRHLLRVAMAGPPRHPDRKPKLQRKGLQQGRRDVGAARRPAGRQRLLRAGLLAGRHVFARTAPPHRRRSLLSRSARLGRITEQRATDDSGLRRTDRARQRTTARRLLPDLAVHPRAARRGAVRPDHRPRKTEGAGGEVRVSWKLPVDTGGSKVTYYSVYVDGRQAAGVWARGHAATIAAGVIPPGTRGRGQRTELGRRRRSARQAGQDQLIGPDPASFALLGGQGGAAHPQMPSLAILGRHQCPLPP